jgi:serine/threonine-protein kinase
MGNALEPADPMLGRVIAGRYRLDARVGEGAIGIVYCARHILIDRIVALKLLRPELRGEPQLRAWMLREARAANRVVHSHIIDIQDIGETEQGEIYLVMEYLTGTSLSSELMHGPMPLLRSVDILEQVCSALACAHDLGVVHRDLKSDHILLTTSGERKDFVKILDFGLAHLAMDPRLAPEGAVFGTPAYMAPELVRGEEATPQTDLYALGVLFFEMLTGQLPFCSDDRAKLLEMQRTAVLPSPTSLMPDLLPEAETVVLKLLEKDRRKRYRDANELHQDLKALQRCLPSSTWEIAQESIEPPRAAAIPSASPTVLIIDDEANLVTAVESILKRAGYLVHSARNGAEGLRMAQERKPDIVLCDVMMPPPNGFKVREQLEKDPITASIPFVFLTARASQTDKLRGLEAGADDYITKPFDRDELLARIKAVLRRTKKSTSTRGY